MKWYVGTSGFSYKEWRGPFYPEKLSAKRMLNFYAGRFPSVEMNGTFYRLPKASAVEAWTFASLAYDGKFICRNVPSAEKYKILL